MPRIRKSQPIERITDLRRSFGVQANGLKLSLKGIEKHFQFGFANLHVCPRVESYAGLPPLLILTRCQVETNYPRPGRNASDAVGIGG
jgi:hypothetical protein